MGMSGITQVFYCSRKEERQFDKVFQVKEVRIPKFLLFSGQGVRQYGGAGCKKHLALR